MRATVISTTRTYGPAGVEFELFKIFNDGRLSKKTRIKRISDLLTELKTQLKREYNDEIFRICKLLQYMLSLAE